MLVLGSTSPRRAELLNQLNLEYTTRSPAIDETPMVSESAEDYVTRMSNEKFFCLLAGPHLQEDGVLLTADTVVVLANAILGKPRDKQDGLRMLSDLSGRDHRVLTSVTIGTSEQYNRQFIVETIVKFRTLTNNEIEAYWQTGEPADKAGAYGIQGIGAVLVDRIEGSYTNVVGLPLTETAKTLADFNVTTLG